MPKIMDRLVSQLRANGMSKDKAYAVATKKLQSSGSLRKGTREATEKGKKRGAMTPAARAKDRAAKRSGGKPTDYNYNRRNNSATKRKPNPKVKPRK